MGRLTAGKIITFYSYKGGTGRSMALANFACWLGRRRAARARPVLMLDWDLEAPGLHRYFSEKAESHENDARPGLINYFKAMAERLGGEPGLYKRLAAHGGWRVMSKEFPLADFVVRGVAPGVDLLKAGRFDSGYAQLVSEFDWVQFYRKYGRVFRALREWVSSDYAHCLIDSRTGFNDASGISTMLMPEKLVLVFTPNRQNLSGVIDLAARAVTYRRSASDFRPLAIFPLPSRIENAEHELKETWREKYQREFEATLKNIYQLDRCDLKAYFDEVLLPHVSFYAYGEELALLREQHSDALSLSRAYESFFLKLDRQEFAWDSPEAEATAEVSPAEPETFRPEGVESDIYISYARLDDYPLPGESHGWVAAFHEALEITLSRLMGRVGALKIWRDTNVGGKERLFDAAIAQQISTARVFIPILSPAYFNSPACQKELDFGLLTEHRKRLQEDKPLRIIPVLASPLAYNDWPSELQTRVYHKFYEGDPNASHSYPYRPEDREFLNKIHDLAREIIILFRSQQSARAEEAQVGGPAGSQSVFLAETTGDLRSRRERVRHELQNRGVSVLPDGSLPVGESDAFSDEVRSYLRRCSLSVHLVGESYGLVPEGDTRSIVELQVDLAAERARDANFSQIVWMPPQLEPEDARHRAFVKRIKGDARPNLEILQTSPGSLMPELLEAVRRRLSAPSEEEAGRTALVSCSARDMNVVPELTNLLIGRDYDIRISPEADDPRTNLLRFEEALRLTKLFVIIFGKVSAEWVRERLNTALQLFVRERLPLKLCAVYAPHGDGAKPRRTFQLSTPPPVPVFFIKGPDAFAGLLDNLA